jgi:hypothetical protein
LEDGAPRPNCWQLVQAAAKEEKVLTRRSFSAGAMSQQYYSVVARLQQHLPAHDFEALNLKRRAPRDKNPLKHRTKRSKYPRIPKNDQNLCYLLFSPPICKIPQRVAASTTTPILGEENMTEFGKSTNKENEHPKQNGLPCVPDGLAFRDTVCILI